MRILIPILLIVVSGCYTPRKAARQVYRAESKYPMTVAGVCEMIYPIKPSTRIEKVTQTDTVYSGDTMYMDCDSIVKAAADARMDGKVNGKAGNVNTHRVPCPPPTVVTNTVIERRTDTFVNGAEAELLRLENVDMQKRYTGLQAGYAAKKQAKNTWMWIALCLMLYLALKTAVRLFFPAFNFIIEKLP